MTPFLASGGILICVMVFRKVNPLRSIREAATLGIAAQYLVGEMAAGAWSRLNRWNECKERAKREAYR